MTKILLEFVDSTILTQMVAWSFLSFGSSILFLFLVSIENCCKAIIPFLQQGLASKKLVFHLASYL